MIPYYLKDHLVKVKEKKGSSKGILASTSGNTDLEIYYYGDVLKVRRAQHIVNSEYPCLIVAKDPKTNEEFTVFDGMRHGYDAMFCNGTADAQRELKLYEYGSGKVQIFLEYSIDYEDEKDDYEFNENGEVVLTYGALDWEKAKSIGFSWLSLRFEKGKKEFAEFELA